MEDSSVVKDNKTESQSPLGMSSSGANDRQQFGQNLRLAMACIEGSVEPVNAKAMPSDEATIHQRLKVLSQDITSSHADLLELLVRFDDIKGWKTHGARHCAAWMNLELGTSLQLGWEYLRVERNLRLFPTTSALFRAGKISWSKIRLIVNVADTHNEKTLCHAALDASVTEIQRLCNGYRWTEDDNGEDENERALKQWRSRSLTWDELSNGSKRIQLIIPPEIARAFLNSVEHSLSQVAADDSDNTLSQRRADAAVLMAETSLQAAGRDIASADRYQVIVSVDASELATPSKRPTVKGASPIARETAKRIACDSSVSTSTTANGEPTDIGRKSRIWPNAMARAIKDRDQHCQFYGCTQTQHLQIHHLIHWADDGTTCVSNGACLCQFHHTMIHEGGYRIQAVASSEQRLNEQFSLQQHVDDTSMFSFEKELRSGRESFNRVRRLSPTHYRFRVVDADEQDLRSRHSAITYRSAIIDQSTITDNRNALTPPKSEHPIKSSHNHSTRVECAEPVLSFYYCEKWCFNNGGREDGASIIVGSGKSSRSRGFNHSAYITEEKRAGYNVSSLKHHSLKHHSLKHHSPNQHTIASVSSA
jgi:hypothetical protein